MYHCQVIQNNPLQTYVSTLLFSPAGSLVRSVFDIEAPDWITIMPEVENEWNACLQTLEGHTDGVISVAFSRDSTRLGSVSLDRTTRIWDASNGECLKVFKNENEAFTSAVFSYDLTRLASASHNYVFKIWDVSSGKCLRIFESEGWCNDGGFLKYPITNRGYIGLAFSHSIPRLATASANYTVNIWDTNYGKCMQTFEGHVNSVTSVAFSHDSTGLASASSDGIIKIWNVESGRCLQTLKGHDRDVTSLAFPYDSTPWLASASIDSSVRIWDTVSGECLQILRGHVSTVCSVAFSPHDSTRLASASGDNTVKIWGVKSGECLKMLRGHVDSVYCVAFSHAARLASSSHDSTIRIWEDNSSGYEEEPREGHSLYVNMVVLSHNSAWLASVSAHDHNIKIWDTKSGARLQTLQGHRGWIWSAAFSYDSTWLASASSDNTVKVWDVRNGQCLQTLRDFDNVYDMASVAFSYDSTLLAVTSGHHTARIWDVSSGNCLQTFGDGLEVHDGNHEDVRSPVSVNDSTRLASPSANSSRNGSGYGDDYLSYSRVVAFSRDSAQLASASDHIIRIWDTSSVKLLQTLVTPGYRSSIHCLAFSHSSTHLASANALNVTVWDIRSSQCLQTIEVGKSLYEISFDLTDLYLETDIGSFAIDVHPASNSISDKVGNRNPRCTGLGLSSDGEWITYKSKNIVWLPFEYRPTTSASAVSGGTICIGTGTGKVWVCNVQTAAFE